jgi:hypothetical protein
MSIKTPGGRILRTTYSVEYRAGRWVVGCGWGRLTLFAARAEAKRRNHSR